MSKKLYTNLSVEELVDIAIANNEVKLSKTNALVVETGKYTGRSPKDRFIVDSPRVHSEINWGEVNRPISESNYKKLLFKIQSYYKNLDQAYCYQGVMGADSNFELPVEVFTEYAYQSLFTRYILCKPYNSEKKYNLNKLKIYCFPNCLADPKKDGTNSEAFIVIDFDSMTVIIGGSKYSGEIKKSMFSVMNYLLPKNDVLPMHCSANMDDNNNSALFFGLSGTGKTTLSADPSRRLIGDDEHGWSENGIFNFEGGCYAKCINLNKEKEPQIYNAVRDHVVVENVVLKENGELDFDDESLTENTRVTYPISYIDNAVSECKGGHPKNVIFLTADAFGLLPPVAKLDFNAAQYYFLSGYTSKLAGTERGVVMPEATFSECFGAAFMPLAPEVYSGLLKKYLAKYKTQVYLVNTGWQGGPYGVGERISIKLTRQIISDILSGKMAQQKFMKNKPFNLDVPTDINDPRELWKDKTAYDKKASEVVKLFQQNFIRFKSIDDNVVQAGPQ